MLHLVAKSIDIHFRIQANQAHIDIIYVEKTQESKSIFRNAKF